MITICIANQKGGIGKSTTAAALTSGLILKGYRALCIDANAQRNLTQTFAANSKGNNLESVLLGKCSITDAIQHTNQGDIVAGSKELANIDITLKAKDKYYKLKEALEPISKDYDYCIIDCPPYTGTLFINSIISANEVIIVCEADIYSLSALEDITENIQGLQYEFNKGLKVAGILLTRFTGRATLSKQLKEAFIEPAEELETKVYKEPIRESIAVKEAHIMQQSIFEYDAKSNPAIDYMAFIEEYLQDHKAKGKTYKKRGV